MQRNHVHEVERVRDVVDLLVTERDKQTIHDELDILAHEIGVHTDELAWQRVYKIAKASSTKHTILHTCEEFLFDGDGIGNDVFDGVGVRVTFEVAE